ncbi:MULTISPECIES: hypothetical protein [Bradyrhizobium]|uniref:hypothetical protein n=1 Tax=Bradyrhizobium TaxID=374 RepID=UPI001BA863D2|nr:hypothetical protein [Bradyrhizobium liaoningense]MBR0988377.1 hypothetical protein [Bradyrhizobium liaoningense]GMO22302.1 hypothetical protein TM233_30470 [Bradyrhizobium sp. TM233]GMP12262.1 hypothetical protein TM239_65040 [Bradyrhizobium sp. TM239]
MSSQRLFALAILVAGSVLAAAPANAQLVLICYTLHNDLANFDRRAHQVAHFYVGGPRSHLGGADAVRLRIIDQMRQLGCPLPLEPVTYRDFRVRPPVPLIPTQPRPAPLIVK